jgi:hypothetical protein
MMHGTQMRSISVLDISGGPLSIHPARLNRKLDTNSKYIEAREYFELLLSYAILEEEFLSDVARKSGQKWHYEKEAGARELTAMVIDMQRLVDDFGMREDLRTETQLKEWVRLHPNAQFLPYGYRMKRSRRAALRAWAQEVRTIGRRHQDAVKESQFMRRWTSEWGSDSKVTTYHPPHQLRMKIKGKNLRKLKIGKAFL